MIKFLGAVSYLKKITIKLPKVAQLLVQLV
jgi:hypothetical protein